jgi:hypothetical protein
VLVAFDRGLQQVKPNFWFGLVGRSAGTPQACRRSVWPSSNHSAGLNNWLSTRV